MNDFNNIQIVQQPKDLNVKLYTHQLASIYNMEKLEVNNIISIGNYQLCRIRSTCRDSPRLFRK